MNVLKRKSLAWTALALILAFVLVTVAVAQTGAGFDLRWHTLDGGGGHSAAAGYELNGTIGQPDAASIAQGDGYSLSSGYWNPAVSLYLPVMVR